MGNASRDKRPLKDIAIIDSATIGEIAEKVVELLPSGPGGTYEHPATHPATMITEDSAHTFVTLTQKNSIHAQGSDNQDLSGLQSKETGKGLSTNDLTNDLKGDYDKAVNHAESAHLVFSGLTKITVGLTEPITPGIGDLWIDTNI